ncbi:MAG: transglycosylase domain-containing protein [Flavobacteriales bacterium]|nr:transglycosylase domain-containing protein [Flavobacteriales bacterium]
MKKYILWFWSLLIFGTLCFAMLFVAADFGWLGKMPTVEDLQNPKSNLASVIYSSDGKTLGKYFYQNRTNAHYQDLSPHLMNALVATEDERYYDHPGIDFIGTLRAVAFLGSRGGGSTVTQQLAKMLFTERRSQNFAKAVVQKIKEYVISAKLERYFTKQEILAMYYNRFDFVNNAVGINSASSVYFNVSPDSLKIHQAAMLAGMAKNPALFNPIRRPDTVMHRRNVVFGQMLRNAFISQAEFDSLKQLPLDLDYQVVDHSEGIAPYFREALRANLKEILNAKKEGTEEYLVAKPNGDPYNVYSDGLKIYTTIDSRMQKYAEYAVERYLKEYLQADFAKKLKKRRNFPFASLSDEEVESVMNSARRRTGRYRVLTGKECSNCHRRGSYISKQEFNGRDYWICKAEECGEAEMKRCIPEDSIEVIFNHPVPMKVFSWRGSIDTTLSPNDSIRYYKSFLQAGMTSIDPHTGHVKAWVGGINHHYFAYDHVQSSKRQVGSTFKPFVYALALEAGIPACREVPDIEYCFQKDDYGLQKDWCPRNSHKNTGEMVTLKYGLAQSMNNITAWVMTRFSPQAAVEYAHRCGIESFIDPVPALALGVADLSVFEMTNAYSTFANKGRRMDPIYLLRIEDNSGTIIFETEQDEQEVMSEEVAYQMVDLMKGVTVGEYGPEMKKDPVTKEYYLRYKTSGTAIRMRSSYENDRDYDNIPYSVEIAGKTGTTQGNSDGWFMGFVPDLVTGVWVGAEDRSVRFLSTNDGQGTNTALPIWCYYMHKVWDDKKLNITQRPFDVPESMKNYNFDCDRDGGQQDPFARGGAKNLFDD